MFVQAGSRVICMTHLPWCGVVLLGTLDFSIHAVSCSELRHLWSVKLNDSVLALHGDNSHSVFAALADGCVAVLQVSLYCLSGLKCVCVCVSVLTCVCVGSG